LGSVYEKLTAYDDSLKPQPLLAESWDFSADAKQLKFNLRKGVQFHTGRELTSDDVKWNLLRVRDPKVGVAQFAAQSNWFTSIDTPDKYTIVLTSDQPRPAVFDLFEQLNMLDHETMEGPDSARKAVGTGPFTFVEWAQGDHLRFTKNNNYWRSGRPYLDSLLVTINSDPQAMVTQLEAGALDAANLPPVRDAVRLQKDPKYQLMVNQHTGGYYLIALNTALPPLDKKEVRQALNYAIDRKRFAETVLLGTSEAESLPWPSFAPAYEAAKKNAYAFDLDKAKSVLNQAGVSGFEMDLVFSTVGAVTEYAALGRCTRPTWPRSA
jgi:peptide/nickel transport system substrate-binding protein